MTAQAPDGSWLNVPSLWLKNGRPYVAHDEDEAIGLANASGLDFPAYGSEKEANDAATDRENAWQGIKPQQASKIAPLWTTLPTEAHFGMAEGGDADTPDLPPPPPGFAPPKALALPEPPPGFAAPTATGLPPPPPGFGPSQPVVHGTAALSTVTTAPEWKEPPPPAPQPTGAAAQPFEPKTVDDYLQWQATAPTGSTVLLPNGDKWAIPEGFKRPPADMGIMGSAVAGMTHPATEVKQGYQAITGGKPSAAESQPNITAAQPMQWGDCNPLHPQAGLEKLSYTLASQSRPEFAGAALGASLFRGDWDRGRRGCGRSV